MQKQLQLVKGWEGGAGERALIMTKGLLFGPSRTIQEEEMAATHPTNGLNACIRSNYCKMIVWMLSTPAQTCDTLHLDDHKRDDWSAERSDILKSYSCQAYLH